MPTVTPLGIPPLSGAIGSDYRVADDRLIFVEFATGTISQVLLSTNAYAVLGTGYTEPEDIVVSSDETTAYVTERSGNLLAVDLHDADRSAATVVAGGLTAPHQITLDEVHGHAYVVEFADPGRLLRVDLATGAATTLIPDLHWAIGLLLSPDLRYAYVTEQIGTGRLSRIDLSTSLRTLLFTSPTAPLFFMTWAGPGHGAIVVPERDPADTIWKLDLTTSPPSTTQLATSAMGIAPRPSSVAATSPDILLVCSDSIISQVDLVGGVYNIGGPMLLGIGLVPVDRINQNAADPRWGYADTTTDPTWPFQVLDAPFGGLCAIMFNHDKARTLGAHYYKILVDGVAQTQSWTDYLWNNVTSRFDLQTINPINVPGGVGFYSVRDPGDIWFTHWLGYWLDTTAFAGGTVHTISVEIFQALSDASTIDISGDPHPDMAVMIDNRWPMVSIDQILHDGLPVPTCGIIDSGSYLFDFVITARDLDGNLKSWSLLALWGDNKSSLIASDNYPSVDPPPTWVGPLGVTIGGWDCQIPPGVLPPDPAADPTSWRCAHTFRLGAWDRAIDGYTQLHYAEYDKSITIYLPPAP